MTRFEIINLSVSLLALLISGIFAFRQYRFQKISAKLASKNLEIIEQAEADRKKVRISINAYDLGSIGYFLISNISEVEATNITIQFPDERISNMLRDYHEKIPYVLLSPGREFKLNYAQYDGSPRTYKATISWTNPDGSSGQDEYMGDF